MTFDQAAAQLSEASAKKGRPAWYPFRTHPPDGHRVPKMDVVMTEQEAKRYYQTLFGQLIDEIMNDPRATEYERKMLLRFLQNSRGNKEFLVSVSARYSGTVPASIHASGREPGRADVTFYMPLWKEYEREYDRDYLKATFVQVVTHEMEHFDEGYWRPDRSHTSEENSRTEALTWSRTCIDVIFPQMKREIEPGLNPRYICTGLMQVDSLSDHPDFIAHVSSLGGY